MCKVFRLFIAVFSVFSLALLSVPQAASAQYLGSYDAQKKKKYVDAAARPVPRVFSSKVRSTQEAEKLDQLYNQLFISLWNYAISDMNYQKKLYILLEGERFKTTRYAKEFSVPLEGAMDTLNQNHNSLKDDIKQANEQYEIIKEGILVVDHPTIDKLWPEKVKEFEIHAQKYFDMQFAFLKTYRALVGFIMKQGGSYYYDSAERAVKFYDLSGWRYYGESLDKLRKITYTQKQHLKQRVPANVSVDTLQ